MAMATSPRFNLHHGARAALCALALLCAAPSAHAQCSWEAQRPRRAKEAREDSIRAAIREAQRSTILGAAAAAGVEEPHGLVAISVDRDGARPTLRLFDANFPDVALERVGAELVALTRQHTSAGHGRLAAVVRLDTLPLPPARADGRRRECTPVLTNSREIRQELDRWVAGGAGHDGRADVSMLVDRAGRVRHAEIRSRSGSAMLDELVLKLAARATFRPASVDGVARDVWVSLPFTVQMP